MLRNAVVRPPLGLSCDAGCAVLFLGDNFQTTLSSAGETSTLSIVRGVLDIKSDNGTLCGIGVAGLSANALSIVSGGAGVIGGLYAKFCNLFIVTSEGFLEVGVFVVIDLFSDGRLKDP
jgi:hypothetical protein